MCNTLNPRHVGGPYFDTSNQKVGKKTPEIYAITSSYNKNFKYFKSKGRQKSAEIHAII